MIGKISRQTMSRFASTGAKGDGVSGGFPDAPASRGKSDSVQFRANLFSVSVVQDASQTFILHNRNPFERRGIFIPGKTETGRKSRKFCQGSFQNERR